MQARYAGGGTDGTEAASRFALPVLVYALGRWLRGGPLVTGGRTQLRRGHDAQATARPIEWFKHGRGEIPGLRNECARKCCTKTAGTDIGTPHTIGFAGTNIAVVG